MKTHVRGPQLGDESPDVEPKALAAAFETTQKLLRERKISAGHDISDGGIAVALLEMAFAGNTGFSVIPQYTVGCVSHSPSYINAQISDRPSLVCFVQQI